MGKWMSVENSVSFARKEIPLLHVEELASDIVGYLEEGLRVVHYYGRRSKSASSASISSSNNAVTITCVLADDTRGSLLIADAHLKGSLRYPSITVEEPAMHLFERELYEQTGAVPVGHPWLKPVRFDTGSHGINEALKDIHKYPFYALNSTDAHESALGPVYSGITEPGHFRFLCFGEDVLHLEVQLGYQHRGIERLLCSGNPMKKSSLVESIAGDSVIAHAWSYTLAIEALNGVVLSKKVELIRSAALELERMAMHLAGLEGISSAIAFLPGATTFGRLRNTVLDLMLQFSGCRFGRGLIRPGGVLRDINNEIRELVLKTLDGVEQDLEMITGYMFDSSGVVSRLEGTGTITPEQALQAGLVGIVAKASGLPMDCRADQPFGLYEKDHLSALIARTGDVYARTKIRLLEIDQSIKLIRRWLNYGLMIGEIMVEPPLISAESMVVTLVEGFRGEVSHSVTTGPNSEIEHYKVMDASFHNWMGLALALRGNGISDFSLCNESFGLSSCGHDL